VEQLPIDAGAIVELHDGSMAAAVDNSPPMERATTMDLKLVEGAGMERPTSVDLAGALTISRTLKSMAGGDMEGGKVVG
jgi:hypothetical protein